MSSLCHDNRYRILPSSLHPSTAPTRDWVSVSLLQYVAARKSEVLGHPRQGASTVRAYSGAGTSTGWLYSTVRHSVAGLQGNFRVSGAGGLTVGAPMTDQSFHRLVLNRPFFSAIAARSSPPCTLPCGPHLPPSLPWLLGCSVAFSIPRTPYMAR